MIDTEMFQNNYHISEMEEVSSVNIHFSECGVILQNIALF